MKVRVYRNLHKKCYSIQAKINGSWRVIDHADSVTLVDVTFKVSQAGRERVLRERRKNVHAFVYGTIVQDPGPVTGRRVSYNPYKADSFTSEGLRIAYAGVARIDQTGITI